MVSFHIIPMLRAISSFLEDLVTESNSSRSPVGCLVLRKYQQSKMTPVRILKRSGPLPFLIVFEMIQDWRSAIWVTGWVRRLSCSFLFLLSPYGACVCVWNPLSHTVFFILHQELQGGRGDLQSSAQRSSLQASQEARINHPCVPALTSLNFWFLFLFNAVPCFEVT